MLRVVIEHSLEAVMRTKQELHGQLSAISQVIQERKQDMLDKVTEVRMKP